MEYVNDKPIYALKNSETVSIEDVPSGLVCGCVCPACQRPLVAKKGEVRAHHFAHYQNNACGYDYLYSIYLLAEKILSKLDKIYIPDNNIYYNCCFVETVQKGFQLPITKVVRKDGKKPKLIVYYKDKALLIKLSKSIRTLNRLKKEMRELKQAAIGIDISETDEVRLEEQLKDLLTKKTDKKIWLYSPKAAVEEDKLILAKEQEKLLEEQEPNAYKIKEELFCKSVVEKQKQLEYQETKNNIIGTSLENIKMNLIAKRAKEKMMLLIGQGKSLAERDPRVTLKAATEEYNAGVTDWAKKARTEVEAELSKVNLK